jgi:hypothetical protein
MEETMLPLLIIVTVCSFFFGFVWHDEPARGNEPPKRQSNSR